MSCTHGWTVQVTQYWAGKEVRGAMCFECEKTFWEDGRIT